MMVRWLTGFFLLRATSTKSTLPGLRERLLAEDVLLFQKGVDIGEQALTLPARLEILSSDTVSEIRLTICEGKFHQVKRMFESVGKKVLYLKRLSMGTLILDDLLPPGAYRTLTAGGDQKLTDNIKKKETGDKE